MKLVNKNGTREIISLQKIRRIVILPHVCEDVKGRSFSEVVIHWDNGDADTLRLPLEEIERLEGEFVYCCSYLGSLKKSGDLTVKIHYGTTTPANKQQIQEFGELTMDRKTTGR